MSGEPPVSFPAVAQVDAYWEGLREGRLMPSRAEVDPRGLEGALEFAFILEYIGRGVGRMRVAGMHLNDLLGMEVRGMPLTSFFTPAAREPVMRALEGVVSQPQVADLSLTSARGIGRPGLSARLYLAPLATDGKGAPRVLGCLQCHGSIGRAPRRFEVGGVQIRRIVATARPEPATGNRDRSRRQPGFAEPILPFGYPRDLPKAAEPRPALRVISNDD